LYRAVHREKESRHECRSDKPSEGTRLTRFKGPVWRGLKGRVLEGPLVPMFGKEKGQTPGGHRGAHEGKRIVREAKKP